jgi:DNA polymerase III epsilon subunit-like protein
MPLTTPDRNDLAAMAWARWILSRPIAILDTETTGLDYDAEIIDIAVVDKAGKVLLDSYVRPTIPIPEEATAIHGITDAMVCSAHEWQDIAPIVLNIFRDYRVLIYNAGYDLPRLRHMNTLHHINAGNLEADCIMLNYAPIWGDWSDYFNNYKWAKLANATPKNFDNPLASHSALGDCLSTLAVIYSMAGVDYQWQVPVVDQLSIRLD